MVIPAGNPPRRCERLSRFFAVPTLDFLCAQLHIQDTDRKAVSTAAWPEQGTSETKGRRLATGAKAVVVAMTSGTCGEISFPP